mmetsp:Transcript_153921/g.473157  ORF Transcript_153921/g.473157 Transcript_153921/m.473157 type:complete len:207 (-) Transcript_153921:362-982(-)
MAEERHSLPDACAAAAAPPPRRGPRPQRRRRAVLPGRDASAARACRVRLRLRRKASTSIHRRLDAAESKLGAVIAFLAARPASSPAGLSEFAAVPPSPVFDYELVGDAVPVRQVTRTAPHDASDVYDEGRGARAGADQGPRDPRAPETRRRSPEQVHRPLLPRHAAEVDQHGQFLSKSGFPDVNEKKKKGGMFQSGFSVPLHVAGV